jgi:SAM-dependent methyltransferase
VPILGQSDDPRLPNGLADLAFMNRVFHHFSQPRAMLRSLWLDLKPGGYLVIVDQKEGPLTDWTPMEKRQDQHHWTGETTVVRLAREEGFLFHDLLDDLWHEKKPFVLAFQRPRNGTEPKGDPDPAQPLADPGPFLKSLPLPKADEACVLYFGLDGGRSLLETLRAQLNPSVSICDVVLEEWALAKDETPSGSKGEGIETLRTEKGELQNAAKRSFQAILFADAYHRLWDPAKLLAQLRDRLPQGGHLVILDRQGPNNEPRRQAGHHRRISPKLVRQEMKTAGFEFVQEMDAPSPDRFVLVFR